MVEHAVHDRRQLVEINPPVSWWRGPARVVRNAWHHRSLLRTFVLRDLRIRYRDSALGYLWSLLEPLLLTATYYIMFMVIAGRTEHRYPLWVLTGVLVWRYFADCATKSMTSLTGNAGLIKQVYFPRELFAITNALSQFLITALSLLIVIPFLLYYGIPPNWHIIYVPLGLVMAGLFGLGLGLTVSCLNAVHRDVEQFMKVVLKMGMFLSPVMWTMQHIDNRHGHILKALLYNPMVLPISLVRSGLEGKPLPSQIHLQNGLYSLAVCLGVFVLGAMFFKRFEAEAVKHI